MSTDPLTTAIFQRDCWITQARQLEREIARLRGVVNHERWEKMKCDSYKHAEMEATLQRCDCRRQFEQQGDVIERMLYEYMGIEDCREAMTAAAHMLLNEALGPVTDEEAREWAHDLGPRGALDKLLAARRARILPESKPDAAVEAVRKHLKWVGSVYAEDADPVAIVAAVDKARGAVNERR